MGKNAVIRVYVSGGEIYPMDENMRSRAVQKGETKKDIKKE